MGSLPVFGVMACGSIEDVLDALAVEALPVTVLVVGATMMVVGSHEAVSESVAVGKRLVPKVCDGVGSAVVDDTIDSVELVGTAGGSELDDGSSVSEAVLVGGRVTVLSKLDVKVGVGSSESVEFAGIVVGRSVVGVIVSALFDSDVRSVPEAVAELPNEEVGETEDVILPTPVTEALFVPVEDGLPVNSDPRLLRSELKRPVGEAVEPVTRPVGVPVVVNEPE